MTKVMLILIDGLRPDALETLNHPFYRKLLASSCWSLEESTIMPSVTLPCHMSLFHSVPADRHGIISNTYAPQVRPINGICEVLKNAGKSCSFFYSWEPLRDLARPLTLTRSDFASGSQYTFEKADDIITSRVLEMIEDNAITDFTFFYLCWVDEAGHKYGWMSKEYLEAVSICLDRAQQVADALPEDVKLIITADHGGHQRSHGSDAPEDMLVPLFMRHKDIAPGKLEKPVNIIDIAPTITGWLGVNPDPDWEGNSIF